MLCLKNIVKNYYVGGDVVRALRGVSLNFRESEFVAVLGQSGCGKTTLLNIVGGLDKYTEGDLIINGVSTKTYTDRDWDAYRNNSIGFVFQSYNLIPHQTVFENVELALTLSGVSQEERKRRVVDALNKVGLGDQIKKRPNQLSGGQMQRVAIARAIVNNPDIILADEPTGALDSDTSIQIMDILKEIAKEKLVIMVTHNPELAEEYSNRIINLKDGLVIGDTNPYEGEECDKTLEELKSNARTAKIKRKRVKTKHSMGFFTALKLSLKNLFTKKARTILTSFAGSIGIVGIALILSLSSGFTAYIDKVQMDTLSNYPISIEQTELDMTTMLESFAGGKGLGEAFPDGNKINSNDALSEMFSVIFSSAYENDLKGLKDYLDSELQKEDNKDKISAIKYIYDLNVSWYRDGLEVNDFSMGSLISGNNMSGSNMAEDFIGGVFQEMIDNEELIKSQYDVLYGRLPGGELKANEAILVLDNYNGINDLNLYNMGFKTDKLEYNVLKTSLLQSSIQTGLNAEQIEEMLSAEGLTKDSVNPTYTFEDFKDLTFKVLTQADYYNKGLTGLYEDLALRKKGKDRFARKVIQMVTKHSTGNTIDDTMLKDFMLSALEKEKLETATEVKIVGIVRKKEGVASGALKGTVCYTKELTNLLIEKTKQSTVYKAQVESADNVVTGEKFVSDDAKNLFLESIGVVNKEKPVKISIYPTTFENKDYVVSLIDKYNEGKPKGQEIKYTDYLGIMMSSITIIINAISYVLIAFVSISLVVSSIMIGIITYISVLERTKEIGVLRSLGASKKDISRVFNAETLIVGFVAGMLGILITVLLNIPITLIVQSLAEITAVASLPFFGGVILVVISTLLTLIAGIIPSRMAAKKDPVIALRTE